MSDHKDLLVKWAVLVPRGLKGLAVNKDHKESEDFLEIRGLLVREARLALRGLLVNRGSVG